MNSTSVTLGVVAALAVGALVWRHQTAGREVAAVRGELVAAAQQVEELKTKLGHQEQLAAVSSNQVQELLAAAAAQSNEVVTLKRQRQEAEQRSEASQAARAAQEVALREATQREQGLQNELAAARAALGAAHTKDQGLHRQVAAAEEARLQFELRARREAAERERLFWAWNSLEAVEAQRRLLTEQQAAAKKAETRRNATPAKAVEAADHGAGRLLQVPALPAPLDDGRPLELQPDGSVRPAAVPGR